MKGEYLVSKLARQVSTVHLTKELPLFRFYRIEKQVTSIRGYSGAAGGEVATTNRWNIMYGGADGWN